MTLLFYQQQIEKKRRDRINSSLAELRQLVPAALRKQVRINNNSIKFKLTQIVSTWPRNVAHELRNISSRNNLRLNRITGIQELKLQYYERWKDFLLGFSCVGILRVQYRLYPVSRVKIDFAGINEAWESRDTPIDSRALERFKIRRWIQQRWESTTINSGDKNLFERTTSFTKLISLEHEPGDRERFCFNLCNKRA